MSPIAPAGITVRQISNDNLYQFGRKIMIIFTNLEMTISHICCLKINNHLYVVHRGLFLDTFSYTSDG